MTFSFMGIDHIQLAAPANCEAEARAFYGEVLGMNEIPKPENLQKRGGCWFQCGNQEVHIGVQQEFIAARKAHPGFIVNQIEELKNQLQQKGILIKEEEPINGRTRFFVDDPFGNRIEFLQYQ